MDNDPAYTDKPYKTGGYRDPKSGTRERVQNRTVEILPHPEVLESYNYVVAGSADTIISMFENEQKHRHEWELLALQVHKLSTMLGQIFGFLLAATIFISATVIGIQGNSVIAALIWVSSLSIIAVAGLIWSYAKSMGTRPLLPTRVGMRNS